MDHSRFPKDFVDRIIWRRGKLHPYETLDPARTALIVVDMQNVYMAEGALIECAEARDIVPNINRLARATRDAGGKVVFLAMTFGEEADQRWANLLDRMLSPERGESLQAALTPGAKPHEFWPDIEIEDGDLIVPKTRFGGFAGSNGALERELRDAGIDTVLVCGTVTNVCCETTAREAAQLDFRTIMVADANGGRTPEQNLATFSVFLDVFGDIRDTDELVEMLKAAGENAAPARRSA